MAGSAPEGTSSDVCGQVRRRPQRGGRRCESRFPANALTPQEEAREHRPLLGCSRIHERRGLRLGPLTFALAVLKGETYGYSSSSHIGWTRGGGRPPDLRAASSEGLRRVRHRHGIPEDNLGGPRCRDPWIPHGGVRALCWTDDVRDWRQREGLGSRKVSDHLGGGALMSDLDLIYFRPDRETTTTTR